MSNQLRPYCHKYKLSFTQIWEFICFSQAQFIDLDLIAKQAPSIHIEQDEAKVSFNSKSKSIQLVVKPTDQYFLVDENLVCLPDCLNFIIVNHRSRSIFGLIDQITNTTPISSTKVVDISYVASLIQTYLSEFHLLSTKDQWVTINNVLHIASKTHPLQIQLRLNIRTPTVLSIVIQIKKRYKHFCLYNSNGLLGGDDLKLNNLLECILLIIVELIHIDTNKQSLSVIN
ncbi:MAG: hypothetical protein KC646_11070 [Candidatus Cloacimonetes bacterium]|nr:hypothetical protein [Candidatus Cloacimonadota bacterium]